MIIVLAAVTQFGQVSWAAPLIGLQSDPPHLSALQVGQTVTIDVVLSGLAGGDVLELLGAEVDYSNTHFRLPTVLPGAIIPDVTGFEPDEFAGLAGGSFDMDDTLSGTDQITANGIFFSFDVQARRGGMGQFTVGFADAFGLAGAIDGADAGSPLPYTVIPEPMSAFVVLSAVLMLGRGRRGRVAAPPQ